jgi:hypothetical protein
LREGEGGREGDGEGEMEGGGREGGREGEGEGGREEGVREGGRGCRFFSVCMWLHWTLGTPGDMRYV